MRSMIVALVLMLSISMASAQQDFDYELIGDGECRTEDAKRPMWYWGFVWTSTLDQSCKDTCTDLGSNCVALEYANNANNVGRCSVYVMEELENPTGIFTAQRSRAATCVADSCEVTDVQAKSSSYQCFAKVYLPSGTPSMAPSVNPSSSPTTPRPTRTPTVSPSFSPSLRPSTSAPTTPQPSSSPSTGTPSQTPTTVPSEFPTTSQPTLSPTLPVPSVSPTEFVDHTCGEGGFGSEQTRCWGGDYECYQCCTHGVTTDGIECFIPREYTVDECCGEPYGLPSPAPTVAPTTPAPSKFPTTYCESFGDIQCICPAGSPFEQIFNEDGCLIDCICLACQRDPHCNGHGSSTDLEYRDGCVCDCDQYYGADDCSVREKVELKFTSDNLNIDEEEVGGELEFSVEMKAPFPDSVLIWEIRDGVDSTKLTNCTGSLPQSLMSESVVTYCDTMTVTSVIVFTIPQQEKIVSFYQVDYKDNCEFAPWTPGIEVVQCLNKRKEQLAAQIEYLNRFTEGRTSKREAEIFCTTVPEEILQICEGSQP